jgi:type I restriction enzyme S subunit
MQKIFNREIRFKDRAEESFPEWEYFSGDIIFKSVNNRNHNSELPILSATQDRGMYPRSENGIDIISSEKSVSSYKVINKGDYVISLRSFQGGIEYSEYDGISSPAYTVLKPIKEISDNFFRAYFKKDSFISQLNGTVVGIRDGKQISFSAFSTLELPYPCIEEQELIANFLSLIDKKIALCNAELIATKKYKQGLLRQMFI